MQPLTWCPLICAACEGVAPRLSLLCSAAGAAAARTRQHSPQPLSAARCRGSCPALLVPSTTAARCSGVPRCSMAASTLQWAPLAARCKAMLPCLSYRQQNIITEHGSGHPCLSGAPWLCKHTPYLRHPVTLSLGVRKKSKSDRQVCRT